MAVSFGEHLVNEILPKEYHGAGQLTKGKLREVLVDLAKKSPEQYPHVVSKLKALGDRLSTQEGISVGVDDVAPDYEKRDAIIDPFVHKFDRSKSDDERRRILVEAQGKIVDYTKEHTGTMAEMARSGGRGSAPQLMKIVGTPVLALGDKDEIIPWFIRKSYSEGLKPSDAWAAGNEARILEIKTRTSVSEPGDLGKILINNMSDQLVTRDDCNTDNGIVMNTDDPHIIDRYLVHKVGPHPAGSLITPQVATALRKESETCIVRSPMTCEAPHGLCQRCVGLAPNGKTHPIGTNVGLRSAQAMAEPLTQMALGAKHAKDLVKAKTNKPEGMKGVRQILEIPESFLHKAALAGHDGTISRVEEAPQGGHYVWVDEERHYVEPTLAILVKKGDKVEAGDTLSEGTPKPDEVVQHKGLGHGRKYVVDTMYDIYKGSGIELDKRHFETLARSTLNHVRVLDANDHEAQGLVRGDIVNYNRLRSLLHAAHKDVPLEDALEETLSDNVLHFTAGTRITPSMISLLERQGIKKVPIAVAAPKVEPMMRPATRTPLMNPDWMARLAHRYLKESLLAGTHRGDRSDTHGTNPVPAFAFGAEFGQGGFGGNY